MILLACACLVTRSWSGEREEEESGPRLILPGSHVVQPGQLVALEWTPDDEVTELEILLSLDGGRTYPIWISPRLAPRDCRFVWRVPPYAGRSLRMRIRFNRDGREIEGAPTSTIDVAPANAPEPLGLPVRSAEPDRVPRPGGENRAPGACGTCETAQLTAPARSLRRISPRTATAHSTASTPRGSGGPAFVPLRA